MVVLVVVADCDRLDGVGVVLVGVVVMVLVLVKMLMAFCVVHI